MIKDYWIYLVILSVSTYLIRAVPFVAVQKKITNKYVRSFLFYIPYTVLAAMTFPAALYATGNVIAAASGLVAGTVVAFRGRGLTLVAAVCCVTVLAVDFIMGLI